MAGKKEYTEEDLHSAFICGMKEAQKHAEGDPEPDSQGWIDSLFYHGFGNERLFERPGYHPGPRPKAAKAGK